VDEQALAGGQAPLQARAAPHQKSSSSAGGELTTAACRNASLVGSPPLSRPARRSTAGPPAPVEHAEPERDEPDRAGAAKREAPGAGLDQPPAAGVPRGRPRP